MAVLKFRDHPTLERAARAALQAHPRAADRVHVLTGPPGIRLEMPDEYVDHVIAELYPVTQPEPGIELSIEASPQPIDPSIDRPIEDPSEETQTPPRRGTRRVKE